MTGPAGLGPPRLTAPGEEGVVALVQRQTCHVVRADGTTLACTVRGRLLGPRGRLGNEVVAGDRVTLQRLARGGVIRERLPRRSQFHRRAAGAHPAGQVVAANLDQIVVVASAGAPAFRPGFVDRVTVQAASCGIPARVVLNKADLADGDAVAHMLAPYRSAGYDVLATCATRGEGVERLRQACRGRRTLFVGQSGVGKSTLLNAVGPGLGLRVGDVNPKTLKGRHITTAAWLRRVPPDLEVIDTPGVRQFGLWDVAAPELDRCFPEFAGAGPCRFADCRHRAEPGCAVREAARDGRIFAGRYDSYLKLFHELSGAPRHGRR